MGKGIRNEKEHPQWILFVVISPGLEPGTLSLED